MPRIANHGVPACLTYCLKLHMADTVSTTQVTRYKKKYKINPLNAELNPIRHLLALVGARNTVHVSRIRVNTVWVFLSFDDTVSSATAVRPYHRKLWENGRTNRQTVLLGLKRGKRRIQRYDSWWLGQELNKQTPKQGKKRARKRGGTEDTRVTEK